MQSQDISKGEIVVFQPKNGPTEYQVILDPQQDTVWVTEAQISTLFGKARRTIGEHISNIYNEGELEQESTWREFRQVQQEGSREVSRKVSLYNLDLVISVGYRVKSPVGIEFRKWATARLKDYLIKGYAINQKRLEQTQQELKILHSGIQILGRAAKEKAKETGYEWLNHFEAGLLLLDDYDHENLDTKGETQREAVYPNRKDYQALIEQMKREFESSVFGVEKDRSFESSITQIKKGFRDDDFYPTIEEKAATLLYLIIKNHSFADGNKRIAAACFLLFLKQNDLLFDDNQAAILSNDALASLTLFIAASKPEEMETVKYLVVSILNKRK